MTEPFYKVSSSSIGKLSFGKMVVTNLERPELPLFEFVGAAVDIWQILLDGSTLSELLEELESNWEDFGPEQEIEVREFINDLLSKGFVVEENR